LSKKGRSLPPTYDANGNMTAHGSFTISGGPTQFELEAVAFTYDRNNRLRTYTLGSGATCTLYWDAFGRIREKTWTNNHQVFYHDGRQLVQIWDQTVNGAVVTRTLSYDLFRGQIGYLKDIDFVSNPDEESYLIKDEQGTVRRLVKVSWSGGVYTVTQGDVPLDAYGDWFDPASVPSMGAHYMRYIGCRVEGYADAGTENQALLHTDHRHYYAPLGVFLQREPLLVGGKAVSLPGLIPGASQVSPYRYCENCPAQTSDSSGLAISERCKPIVKTALAALLKCQNDAYHKAVDRYNNLISCANKVNQECKGIELAMNIIIALCFIVFCLAIVGCTGTWLAIIACMLAALIAYNACIAWTTFEKAQAKKHANECSLVVNCWLWRTQDLLDKDLAACNNQFCIDLKDCGECPSTGAVNQDAPAHVLRAILQVIETKVFCCPVDLASIHIQPCGSLGGCCIGFVEY
jgi:YD repeat-containing protein